MAAWTRLRRSWLQAKARSISCGCAPAMMGVSVYSLREGGRERGDESFGVAR
jgi:hypothetical protein